MDEVDKEYLLLVLLLRRCRRRMRKIVATARTKHKFWIINIYQNRDELGEYHRLVQELKLGDREYFFRYI